MPNSRFQRIGELSTSMVLNSNRSSNCGVMTIPIVGVPRGGTTLVAAVAHALGVYLGPLEDLTEYHFEDQTMHSPNLDIQYRGVQRRNRDYKIWGWKDPIGIASVQSIVFALRNPHVIIVFRDWLASIQGEMRFDKNYEVDPPRTFQELIESTSLWWDANMRFLSRTQFPTMLVSYERVLSNPDLFIVELERFLHLKPSDEQRTEARARISQSGGYLITDPQWVRENSQ